MSSSKVGLSREYQLVKCQPVPGTPSRALARPLTRAPPGGRVGFVPWAHPHAHEWDHTVSPAADLPSRVSIIVEITN